MFQQNQMNKSETQKYILQRFGVVYSNMWNNVIDMNVSTWLTHSIIMTNTTSVTSVWLFSLKFLCEAHGLDAATKTVSRKFKPSWSIFYQSRTCKTIVIEKNNWLLQPMHSLQKYSILILRFRWLHTEMTHTGNRQND